ncbi:hypothetical protein F4802DRAFT_616317 [Xylaria palmicola]|nr:hypothetical protein F4802DRAFT_616317 [Xylaria palmicola]
MRWLLPALTVPAGLLFTLCEASSLQAEDAIYDGGLTNTNHTLWRRVRTGGGTGAGWPTTISGLYELGDASTMGGCVGSGATTLNNWLEEAGDMHIALTQAYQNHARSESLRALWGEFFGVTFQKDGRVDTGDSQTAKIWTAIGDRLARVGQFLAGGGVIGSRFPGKPWIFCSEPATFADWTQPAKNKYGQYIPSHGQFMGGEFVSTAYHTLADIFPQYQGPSYYAYFNPTFGGYQMEKKVEGLTYDHTKTCAKPGRLAYTNVRLPEIRTDHIGDQDIEFGQYNRFTVLCNDAFLLLSGPHSYMSLYDAVDPNGYPGQGGNALDAFVPLSATLYHEMIHLTDTGNPTADPYS